MKTIWIWPAILSIAIGLVLVLTQKNRIINWLFETQVEETEQKLVYKNHEIRLLKRSGPFGPTYIEGFADDILFFRCQGSSISGTLKNDTLKIQSDCQNNGE